MFPRFETLDERFLDAFFDPRSRGTMISRQERRRRVAHYLCLASLLISLVALNLDRPVRELVTSVGIFVLTYCNLLRTDLNLRLVKLVDRMIQSPPFRSARAA
jgi:hypothetical protein